jgi:hypothetical protein
MRKEITTHRKLRESNSININIEATLKKVKSSGQIRGWVLPINSEHEITRKRNTSNENKQP